MHSRLLCAALALAMLAGGATASTVRFKAHLTGGSEAPPNTVSASGDLTASLDTDTRLLTYKVAYKGLTGPATMAHFHGPAARGKNAPPIVVVADPSSPISGEATLTPAQLSDLEKGLWYFNVHTAANPAGEIRGQVKRIVDWSSVEQSAGTGQDLRDLPRTPAQIGNR